MLCYVYFSVPNAISVARKVMEISPHSMLTGEGAMYFAKSNGFVIDESLLKSPKVIIITCYINFPLLNKNTNIILKRATICSSVIYTMKHMPYISANINRIENKISVISYRLLVIINTDRSYPRVDTNRT